MTVLLGFVVAAVIAAAFTWVVVGRQDAPKRDPASDLSVIGGHYVTILGTLSGFAITGVVLLVTLGQDLPDSSSTSFTTLLAMFFVAYLGYFAASLLYANAPTTEAATGFDLQGVSFASASVTLNLTVVLGWLALVPLFETFGLTRMAELAGWLLTAAIIGGYWAVAQNLHRSGYASARLTVVIGVVAILTTLAYAVVAASFGWRSPDSALNLTIVVAVAGALGFAFQSALPMMARQERLAPILAANARLMVVVFAQAAMVFVGVLLLAILGYA